MKISSITKALLCCFLLLSCSSKEKGENGSDSEEKVTAAAVELITEVDTLTLRPGIFAANIISNGRVRAARTADLYFRSSEVVSDVLVRNGQRVRRGQPLARLDLFKLNAEKERNEAALEQARLEMQDVLIGQGYDPADIKTIPDDVIRLARIRCGLLQAETNYNATLRNIAESTLSAPFDGVVANVKTKPYTLASVSEPFCRIIDTGSMEVEFAVLESEGASLVSGERVTATPFSQDSKHPGRISEINPIIDENGHISVKALLSDARGLIDGMNVRVSIDRPTGERLMVPKSAVVLRSGRPVVFTYCDGKALWNYVTTGMENNDSYEITDGLSAGDCVIVSGGENLAHEAPVSIKSR